MDKEKSPKKTPKKKRGNGSTLSKETVSDSENSDEEIIDYENGLDISLDGHTSESIFSDADWHSQDDRTLVEKVKAISKKNDRVAFKLRLKHFDWDKIAFQNYSAKECEDRFNTLMKCVRLHRNLNEIAADIETTMNKSKLKKPLNSYQLFVKDQMLKVTTTGDFSETMKNMGKRYRELPVEEQLIYKNKAKHLLQEYKSKKIELANSQNDVTDTDIAEPESQSSSAAEPKTPFMLYVDSQNSGKNFKELQEEYATLSVDEQYEWIVKAVELAPESIAENLTKDEQRIYRGQIKPTSSAYNLFVKDMFEKIKHTTSNTSAIFAEIGRLWKDLDPYKRGVYAETAAELREDAVKEQKEFNKRHGLKPQKQRRRKSVYVEQPADLDDEDNDDKSAPPTPKKRKISNSKSDESATGKGSATKKVPAKRKAKIKLPKKTPAKPRKKLPKSTAPNDVKDGDDSIATNAANVTNGDVKEETETETQTLTQTQTEPVEMNEDNDDKSAPPTLKKQKISNSKSDESSTSKGSATKTEPAKRKAQIKLPKKTPAKPRKKVSNSTAPNDVKDGDDSIASNAANVTNGEVTEETETETQTQTQTEPIEMNQPQSEASDVNDRVESEAASSSTDTGANKRKRKPQKPRTIKPATVKSATIEPPGDKPPSTLFEYFARFVHTGKPRKAQKAFDKLTKYEEKRMKIDYNEMVETYVDNLKKYLDSLPRPDALAYINKVKAMDGTKGKEKSNDEGNVSQEY